MRFSLLFSLVRISSMRMLNVLAQDSNKESKNPTVGMEQTWLHPPTTSVPSTTSVAIENCLSEANPHVPFAGSDAKDWTSECTDSPSRLRRLLPASRLSLESPRAPAPLPCPASLSPQTVSLARKALVWPQQRAA